MLLLALLALFSLPAISWVVAYEAFVGTTYENGRRTYS